MGNSEYQLVEVELDQRANLHLEEELSYCKGLARACLEQLDIASGKASVLVYEGPHPDLYSFQGGGVVPPLLLGDTREDWRHRHSGPGAKGLAAERICGEGDIATTFFEHQAALRQDRFLPKRQGRFGFHGDDVVAVAFRSEGLDAVKSSLMDAGTAWITWGLGTTASRPEWKESRFELTDEDLSLIASNVRIIVMTVYDCESFLIWRRS